MHTHRRHRKKVYSKNRNDLAIAFIFATLLSIMALYFFYQLEYEQNKEKYFSKSLSLTEKINQVIMKSKGEAGVLAQTPRIKQAILNELSHENKRVMPVIGVAKKLLSASIVYVMNGDGTTIACTPFGDKNSKTLTGKNYKFRAYFQDGISGKNCVYLALGVTTNRRGIYYSAPIKESSGKILGVLVIKKSLTAIDLYINDYPGKTALLVSPEGIIFAATNNNWMYKRVLKVSEKKLKDLLESKQFGNKDLKPLPFTLDKPYVMIDGIEYKVLSHKTAIPGWKVITLWSKKSEYPIIVPLIIVAAVFLLTITIALYMFSIKHRRALNSQINEQNRRLKDANKRLKDEIKGHMQAEKELIEARDAAEVANLAKSNFLANMSHEIRTPMNGVIGMTELLFESPLSKDQKEYCRTIMKSAEALLVVLNDILDFSKMEAGKMNIENIPFNIHGIVDSLGQLFATRKDVHDLNIHVRYEPGGPEWVSGDPARVRQILSNLLGNAIKFTNKGDIILSVRILKKSKADILFEFSVKDTGIGIAKEKLHTIFDKFSQADASTTRKFGGTGLGLTITKQLVDMMGGRISIQSELGKGSNVVFTLPFKLVDPPDDKESELLVKLEDLQNYKVLIVDDNIINRRILTELMNKWGFRSSEAESAEAALKLLENMPEDDPFKIVITDNQMPEMDGIEFAARIKKRSEWSDIVIIMLSSMNMLLQNKKEGENLLDTFLIKPVKHSNLMDAIIVALHKVKNRHIEDHSDLPAEPELEPEPEKHSEQVAIGDKVHVLLVEDNFVNQKLAIAVLNKLGCSVDLAENGQIALDKLGMNEYDIVFMDCQMPILNGYEATGAVRDQEKSGKRKSHIPIIAMTANAMRGDREICLKAGMDDYISKPIKKIKIIEVLKKYTNWKEKNE